MCIRDRCGNESPKWFGQCPACGVWNSCSEEVIARSAQGGELRRTNENRPQRVAEIADADHQRILLSSPEVNRVLGGGLVKGSMVLLGGEPGIGKSTLSLQVALATEGVKTLYVSGEESASQIKMRATFPEEFWALSSFLFEAPTTYDEKATKKYWKADAPRIIAELRGILEGIEEFTSAEMERVVGGWIADNQIGMGLIMNAWRLCIVGEPKGFGMYDMCVVLGKQESLRRLDAALAALPKAE